MEPSKPLFTEPDMDVTRDLMARVAEAVFDAITKVLDIAPPPAIPILLGASVTVQSMLARELESILEAENEADLPTEDELVMLAALLPARSVIGEEMGSFPQTLQEALEDLKVLTLAGRISDGEGDAESSGQGQAERQGAAADRVRTQPQ